MEKRKRNAYLNNKDLLAETILCLEKDRMSDKLARMLMLLVDRYSKRPQFIKYTYLEDMCAYAQYMLVRTWKGFNVERSENAFAFYTQCVHNSFIQYLNMERDHRDIRDALLVKEGSNPSFTYTDSDDSYDYHLENNELNEHTENEHDSEYESNY